MSFIRYPGGKRKLRVPILHALQTQLEGTHIDTYREPFLGGGEINLAVLQNFPQIQKIHINDKDVALASLWTAIRRYPDDLIGMIENFVPSRDEYYKFKTDLQNVTYFVDDQTAILRRGFMKLTLAQMSFSGLGERAGGPMTAIDSRWSPNHLAREIREAHRLFSGVDLVSNRCTTLDFSEVICGGQPALLYLDPPYFEKGGELYKHPFTQADHIRLADALRYTDHRFVLSYDDQPAIRELFSSWANLEIIQVNYSINGPTTKPELLITPKPRSSFYMSKTIGQLNALQFSAAVSE